MSEPRASYDQRSPHQTIPTTTTSKSLVEPDLPPPQSTQVPLTEAIKRGWDWVVFVWQMLQRLGGPLDILRTFWVIASILVTRLLTQLGLIQKGKKNRF